jgi:hypothetical protein
MSLSGKEKETAARLREKLIGIVKNADREALEEVCMSLIAIYATDQFVGPLSLETVKYMTNKTLVLAKKHGLLDSLANEDAAPAAEEPEWTKRARRAVVGGDPNAN